MVSKTIFSFKATIPRWSRGNSLLLVTTETHCCLNQCVLLHKKNDFAEESKVLLDLYPADLKTILLDQQNDFVRTLKITSNAVKNFDIFTISLSVYNYFDSSTKLIF